MNFIVSFLGEVVKFIHEKVSVLFPQTEFLSQYAITLMIVAVIFKLITLPMTFKSAKSMSAMQDYQPQLEAIKKQYGYDEKICQQKTMQFYKEHNLSQMGCNSCFPQIFNIIILLLLYQVIRNPANYINNFNELSKNFFWIPNLVNADPLWFGLPLFYSITMILVSLLNPAMQQSMGMGGQAAMNQKMMTYIMPAVFFFMFKGLPSGLLLYWAFGNVVEIVVRGLILLFSKHQNKEITS